MGMTMSPAAFATDLTLHVVSVETDVEGRSSSSLIDRGSTPPASSLVMRLDEPGAQAFAAFTAARIGRPVEVLVEGRLIGRPVIHEPIRGGRIAIQGLDAATVKEVTARLSTGKALLTVRDGS